MNYEIKGEFMNLNTVLKIKTSDDLMKFLKSEINFNISDSNYEQNYILENWAFIGNDESNASTIDMLENGEKGIVERLTNAIDSVIEKSKNDVNLINPKKSSEVIKQAFPDYYKNYKDVINGLANQNWAYDAADKVFLVVNDGSRKSTPTIDVIDLGTGIVGSDFPDTILSLHKGNKIKESQSYTIGAFGQGGSTSLAFTFATLIISKFNGIYYFTIVSKFKIKGMKNHSYLYLKLNNDIIQLESDFLEVEDLYLNSFVNSQNGTLVRMIDSQISIKYRERDISKPRMLGDYLNIEMFAVGFPIKMVENRQYFLDETNKRQNRYIYGSKFKLLTSKKNLFKDYSGTIELLHNGFNYSVPYYIILPTEREDWSNDNVCKIKFQEFNLHEKPIIFTVNGQYINGEANTRINNRGINFLKYRLLVHIDLDFLGYEKYQFFTTDRSKIRSTDITEGFLEKLINLIVNNPKIIEINDLIGQMQLERGLDAEELSEIAKAIKEQYLDYLKPIGKKRFIERENIKSEISQQEYKDFIQDLLITNTRDEYFKNNIVRLILKTDAYEDINHSAKIDLFINSKQYYPSKINYLNGRIQYILDDLIPGEYSIQAIMFGDLSEIKSNIYNFTISNLKEDNTDEISTNQLDISVEQIKDAELIVDLVNDPIRKKIKLLLCLSHEKMDEIYAPLTEDRIKKLKKDIILPVSLITMFNEDLYQTMEPDKKNDFIKKFVKVQVRTTDLLK